MSEWQGRTGFQVGMLDVFDSVHNKTDACGSTGGEIANMIVSLNQIAGHSFYCSWYSCPTHLLLVARMVKILCILCLLFCP